MNQLEIFKYEEDQVRIVTDDSGEPWFVAKDVAEILGTGWYGNKTIQHVPEEWRGVGSVPTPSAVQEMITLRGRRPRAR